ncbi:MAG: hypothetical protein M1838_005575 [Thelocarpon superellum]|nr:MAG: hypothetical protein M1838_005575 [Thelocarpon superellum]
MASPTFDPFSQNVTLLLADGTPFNITIPDLDAFTLYNVQTCIDYGSQLGASLILLVVLMLLTRAEKRQSPIFYLNALSLSVNFIRSLLQCLYFTSGFNETYAFFAEDYSRVPATDYATSITADVLTLLLLMTIEVSLVLQARVVCATLLKSQRYIITAVSAVVALLAIGFRFALVIINSEKILEAENFLAWQWLASAANITATISICFFCALFAIKLGFALYERKKLGMKQYAPMQIIFIMGSIFAILQYVVTVPVLSTNVLTLVAISLPLSSLWASAAVNGPPASHPYSRPTGGSGSTDPSNKHHGPHGGNKNFTNSYSTGTTAFRSKTDDLITSSSTSSQETSTLTTGHVYPDMATKVSPTLSSSIAESPTMTLDNDMNTKEKWEKAPLPFSVKRPFSFCKSMGHRLPSESRHAQRDLERGAGAHERGHGRGEEGVVHVKQDVSVQTSSR